MGIRCACCHNQRLECPLRLMQRCGKSSTEGRKLRRRYGADIDPTVHSIVTGSTVLRLQYIGKSNAAQLWFTELSGECHVL